MYRSGSEYDEMDHVIYTVYQDYCIFKFPIDVKDVCEKLGVALIPYSSFPSNDAQELMKKKSKQSFFVRQSRENPPTIYYNDNYDSRGSIRISIIHELKHYICEDADDKDDDLADYFGRHFLCPTAYLMLKGIDTPNDIVTFCGVGLEAAINASSNIQNRKEKYGFKLKDYERNFIEMADPLLLISPNT